MRRYGCMLLGAAMVVAICGAAGAASEQAMKLRSQNGLSEFAPPEAFLAGNFLADETEPAFIFGKVRDFTKSLCLSGHLAHRRGRAQAHRSPGPVVGPGRVFHLPGGGLPGQGHLLHLRRPVHQFRPVAGMAPAIPQNQGRPSLQGSQGQPGPGRPERICGGRRVALRGTQRRPAAEAAGRDPRRRAQVPADLRSQEKPGTDQVTRNGLPPLPSGWRGGRGLYIDWR